MRAPTRRLVLLATVLAAASVSCGREITGPGSARRSGPLSFATSYPAALRAAGGHLSSVVAFERVRIVFRRSTGEVAYDRTIDFPSNADSVPLSLSVPLAPGSPDAGEPMSLTLLYVNAAGDTVFTGGPVAVLVTPARAGEPPPAPIPVTLRYTGPGEEAVRLVLSPPSATLVSNAAPLQFTTQAYDEFGTPVQTQAVVFESSDTTVLSVSETGLATPRPQRGTALVIARLFNDGTQSDTSVVTVALPAASIALESGNAQTGVAGAPLAQNVVVRVLAADGVPVTGVPVTFSAANGGAPTGAVVTSDALGYASVAWTLGPGAGAQTLTAIAAGLAGSPVTFTATATGGTPTQLVFTAAPSAVVAGQVIAPAVVVEARTAGGQLASGYTGDVSIAIGSNPANAFLVGSLTVAAVNGVATFPNLMMDRAAAGYTLVASALGLANATSASFAVTAGAATRLQWVVQPVGGTPGVALTPAPAVGAVDQFDNPTAFAGTVTIAIGANPGGSTLAGTTSVAATANVATFTGISLNNLGVGYTLTASAPGLTGRTSDPFTIGAQVISWVNPAGGSWRTSANWNLGRIPTAADVVEIALAGTYTVVLDTSVSVATLNLGGASGTQTLEMVSRTLAVADLVDVRANGVLRPANSTLTGPGAVQVSGGALVSFSSTVSAPLVNGALVVASGSSQFTGSVSNAPGATLRVAQADGCCGTATLTVTNGFTNAGLIELSNQFTQPYGAQLNVTNGTLVNAVGATIAAIGGQTPGGARGLSAQLDNQGLVDVQVPLTLNRPNSAHLNSGSVVVSGGDLTVTQNGAPASFTTSGTVSIGAGRLATFNNGTLAVIAGAIEGSGGLVLNSVTASFTEPVTNANTSLFVNASTINGPGTLTNWPGRTLSLYSSTVNAPFVNEGLLITSGSSVIGGTLTNPAGGTIRVAQLDGCCGTATLTVTNGFTNAGLIELSNQFNQPYGAQLNVTNGTLVNAAGATIAALGGQTPGGARGLSAQLDNQGLLDVAVPLTLNRGNSAHLNSGTIDLTAADLTITQSGSPSSFTNSGTMTLGTGRTLTVQNGTFNQAAGTLGGPGTLALLNLTANFATALSNATTALVIAGTTINGTGTLTNATGRTLTLFSSTVNAPFVNDGLLLSSGSSVIGGTFSNPAGATLRVAQLDGCCGTATLTVTNGFTNAGLIELSNQFNQPYGAQLNVTTGTLVNAVGATIAALGGQTPGGGRGISAQLDNQGLVDVQVPLALNRGNSAHLNSGTIDLTVADLTITQSGSPASFTNSGTMTLGTGRTLTVQNGTFDQAAGTLGGPGTLTLLNLTANFTTAFSNATTALVIAGTTINGPGTLTNASGRTLTLFSSTVNAPLVNDGTLISSGSSVIGGVFTNSPASTMRVAQLDGCCGTATLTMVNGFTNQGLIELSNQFNQPYGAQLTVSSGTLLNSTTGTIAAIGGQTPGGGRTLAAQLDNQGTVLVDEPLTINRAGSDHVNSGTITVGSGNLSIAQSGTTPTFLNQGAITLAAGRTLAVSGGAFTTDVDATIDGGTLALTNVLAAFNDATPAVAALSLVSSTASFTGGLNTTTTALSVAASTLNGTQPLTNDAGQTFTLFSSVIGMPVVNAGTIRVSGASQFTGALTTAPGSVLRIGQLDGATSNAHLTVLNGFTNEGTIELTLAFGVAYSSQLTVTNGTLVNAPGGDILSLPGTVAGGARTLTAQLDNQGDIDVQTTLTMDRPASDHLNSGNIGLTGGNLVLVQSGATPTFVNSGNIAIGAGRTLQVSNGSFTSTSTGTVAGAALVSSGAALAFQAATPALTSFTLTGGSASFADPVSNATTTFALSGGAQLNGAGPFTVPAERTLTLNNTQVNMPVVNEGTIVSSAASSISSLSTAVGSVVRIGQIDGATSLANLTVANGFANSGTIELTNGFAVAYNSQLTITSGELLNTASGTIVSLDGVLGGGLRTISLSGPFTNQGTLSVNPGAAGTLAITTGGFQSTGTINVELGGLVAGTSYDRLAITGPASLGGTLNVGLLGAFTPVTGNFFVPFTSTGALSGTFASILPPAGVTFNPPTYSGTSVTLTVP
jgi:hypothetical protein